MPARARRYRAEPGSPAAPGTGPASCGAAPRPSPGQHAPGPEPSASAGCRGWRSGRAPAAAGRTARRPGRSRPARRSPSGAPARPTVCHQNRTGSLPQEGGAPPTWWRSSSASAPVTSLASSSDDTRPRIPLIHDIRSLQGEKAHPNRVGPDSDRFHNGNTKPGIGSHYPATLEIVTVVLIFMIKSFSH